jgi:UDP-N-acetylglucosamine diphosphorylase / glucose-1-phosphate thymidylyltransferase / UDP-N-acetylgalactosamine diphosphorylase / glucosamine-1-phosphate N-acetyltransferase / galactosamine-1-phosphate N-acetyltransferase
MKNLSSKSHLIQIKVMKRNLEPLCTTEQLPQFLIGNKSLECHQQEHLAACSFSVNWFNRSAWLDLADLTAWKQAGSKRLKSKDGALLVELADGLDADFIADQSFEILYPWDVLRAHEQYVSQLKKSDLLGEVHPQAVLEGVVQIGKGTRLLPGVFIEGNVIIGENCKIGPNCYIRGNTSIGNHCHIGQSVEIKNSIVLSHTNVGHLSYVGDSILGERVNLGAGTTVSNLRHDKANHLSMADGTLVNTGRKKFGTIIGNDVHTGIHTSIYPGRKIWPQMSTLPGAIIQKDLQ